MGRNVLLLYMSPKNPNYKTQTNEGAVRYLIKEKETPDCILALCSERVRKEAKEMPDGSTRTTLEYFRDSFLPKQWLARSWCNDGKPKTMAWFQTGLW